VAAPASQTSQLLSAVRCWEDVAAENPRRVGPLVVSFELLEQHLALLGECHPLHTDDVFARAALGHPTRVVPGSLVPGVVAGWLMRHEGPVAVVGLRSMHWDFVRPLHPGQPFWCEVSVRAGEVVDARTGTVAQTRRLTDEQGRTHAIGRLQLLLLRRDAFVETTGDRGPRGAG
jgi:acyl dehydratase